MNTPRTDNAFSISMGGAEYGFGKPLNAEGWQSVACDMRDHARRLEEECEENKDALTLEGDERLCTFGGESFIDDIEFAEYGIDFGKRAIHGINPKQMVALACIMVDHLLINGHRFEIQKTHEQDQTLRLVPIA